jgi:hypothetical protein
MPRSAMSLRSGRRHLVHQTRASTGCTWMQGCNYTARAILKSVLTKDREAFKWQFDLEFNI